MKIQKTLFSDKEIVVGRICPTVKKKIVFKSYSQNQDFLLPKSLHKIYSCRMLAKELRENLTFIWISGNQRPDFRTLNIDHTKREANANKHKIVWKRQVENQSRKIDEELDKLLG